MPKVRLPNGSEQLLVEPENCFIPSDATEKDGYDSIVTLTAIDLNTPNNVQSVCINALTSGIYASTDNIYLMGTDFERPVVHSQVLPGRQHGL